MILKIISETAPFYILKYILGVYSKKAFLNFIYYSDIAFLAAFSPANLPDVYANPKVPPSNIT